MNPRYAEARRRRDARAPALGARARRRVVARQLESNRRLEARYERALAGLVKEMHDETVAAISPKLPELARADASSPLSAMIDRLEVKYAKRAASDVGGLFTKHARAVADSNAKALRVIGIQPSDLGLGPVIAKRREENIGLVEKAYRSYAQDVRELFEKPETFGLRVEDIQQKLEERGNVSKSRAALIARDQTLKLNGQITKTRQENAGISEYTWSTSGDERVRPEHAALEGRTFAWKSPPSVGHPGDDFQCRCVAIPVLDSIGTGEQGAPLELEPEPPPSVRAPEPPPPVVPAAPVEHSFEQATKHPDVPQDVFDSALRSIDADTRTWLKQLPVDLEVKPQVTYGPDQLAGLYDRGTISVTTDLAPNAYGQPWVPGKSYTVFSSEPTKQDAINGCLRHELGHAIHKQVRGYVQLEPEIRSAYNQAKQRGTFISLYAAENHSEYFAECYAAYYLRKADLQAHDPNGFQLVESVLRSKGIIK